MFKENNCILNENNLLDNNKDNTIESKDITNTSEDKKGSKNTNKNENIIDKIIKDYKRGLTISDLAIKYYLTEKFVKEFLKRPGLETDESEEQVIIYNDNDVYKSFTSLIDEKLKEYGFKDRTDRERNINLVKYIEETTDIDVIDNLDTCLEKLIKDIEITQLESDIESIKDGGITLTHNHFEKKLENNVYDLIGEILEPETLDSNTVIKKSKKR
ncbi:MAG: hypothetical protein P8Y97_17585 [Candidatus Lokiarchaeota archaeon]